MSKSIALEKSIKFALRIVKLARYLSEEKTEFVLSKQILLSGTHIAKFIKDATNAESKQIFAHDMQTALKRASETEFWLLILHEGGFLDEKPYQSINEDCIELIKILTTIVKTSKENA
ncbi:MAG: four helix bundle protein [Acidobacteriota bacterium]|nr:four helix bundle protein [Acidobacteriota bacterium]